MAEFGESLETKGHKMEVDYSATVDKKIPQCEALASVIWHYIYLREWVKEVVIPTYESADIIWCYSHLRVLIFYDHLHATLLFLSFCYAPKRPSPFFLYIPTKNPLFNDKVWTYYRILVSKRVLLLQYNLFITFNEMRVKYYHYCVG